MFRPEGIIAKYSKSNSFEDALTVALKTCRKQRGDKYALLITNGDGSDPTWFEEDKFLEDYDIVPGMCIRLFKALHSIIVHSPRFDTKKVTIDLTKKVSELSVTIGTEMGIQSYHCFTLCSLKERDKPTYMSIDKSIPEQTDYLKEVLFTRQYHIYTMEDLVSIETTEAAYHDIKERADQCQLIMDKRSLIKYIALCMMCERDFNTDNIPDDVSKYCPYILKKTGKGKGKGDAVRRYINKHGELNRFNAYRSFIGFVRRIPGFDSHVFDCIVSTRLHNENYDFDAIVHVSPYRILIVNPRTKLYEERINFSEIIMVQLLSTLEVTFSPGPGRTARYFFEGNGIEKMFKLINRFREITNAINVERAKTFSKKGDFRKLITEKGRIFLKTTMDLSDPEPKEFEYDRKFNGLLLRAAAEKYLRIPPDDNHCIMIHLLDNVFRWVSDNDILETYSLQDGMTIYLLNKIQSIKVFYPDGSSKIIEIDVSKPIEKLTKLIFKKRNLPVLLGYTLWFKDNDGSLVPLDSRNPIPEQCDYYDELYFQRRFFVLSKEVLQSQQSAIQTLHECKNYLFENDIQLHPEKALNLAINYVYAVNEGNIRGQKYNLRDLLPPNIKVTSELTKKFNELLQSSSDITQMKAAKNYIRIVRRLENFGQERIPFHKFHDEKMYKAPQKMVKKGVLAIGPFGINIRDDQDRDLYPRYGYKSIKRWQSTQHEFNITILPSKSTAPFDMYFTLKEPALADMLISYNIKINTSLRVLNQERTREKQEEIRIRLIGGYKDEKGVIHGPMLDFRLGIWGDNVLKSSQWFDLSTEQSEVLRICLDQIKHEENVDYATMVQVVKGENKWLLPGMKLSDVQPYRNAVIYLHKEKLIIQVITSSGQSTKIEINVTNTVAEVVAQVGEKLHISHSLGYTLF
jgi:hypothetical protein